MEIVNKITMKTVMGGDVKPLLMKGTPGIVDIKEAKPIDIAVIYGMAHAETRKDRDTAYGPNVYIAGEFKAQNLLTGNIYYATQLYAPSTLHDLIAAQLKNTEPPIEFGFVVGLKYSVSSGKEYEYTLRSLIEPKAENNPFAKLENQMASCGQPVSNAPAAQSTSKPAPTMSKPVIVPTASTNNPDGVTEPEDMSL